MKKTFLLMTFLLLAVSLTASTLKGHAVNEKGESVGFATLVVMDGTKQVTGMAANDKGIFELDIPDGSYTLQLSYVGMKNALKMVTVSGHTNVGDIIMEEDASELKEVVVKGSTIIRKADKKLLIPTDRQIKQSKDGVDLVKNLQIPSVTINPIDDEIKLADNGKLDLRINGRPVSSRDIKALDPKTIVRVEHHDDPSMRYGDAKAVLDFIVKLPQSGGQASVELQQSPITWGFTNVNASVKLNVKKSEFSFWSWFGPRTGFEQWRDNTENYTNPDGSTYNRIETGVPSRVIMIQHYNQFGYNFTDPGKQLFSAQIKMEIFGTPVSEYEGTLYNDMTKRVIGVKDNQHSRSFSPTLDLYYQRNFGENRLLMFNVVGSYTNSNSRRHYEEDELDDAQAKSVSQIADIYTSIKGDSYGLVAEADYEQTWNQSRMTLGASHSNSWSNSDYLTTDYHDKMRNGKTDIFAEYWYKVNEKFSVTAGLGGCWLTSHVIDGGKTSAFFLRPRLTAKYNSGPSSMTLSYRIEGTNPSVTDVGTELQTIDNYQSYIGNPNVKAFRTHKVRFDYEFTKGILYNKLSVMYNHSVNPIMDEKYWYNNEYIINTVDNQKRLQELMFAYDAQINVIKNWLTVSGEIVWHRVWSVGNDYLHVRNFMSGNGEIQLTHWNFTLSADLQTCYKSMWGETVTGRENYHALQLQYRLKQLSFGLGMLNPFWDKYKYKIPSENLNKYAGYNRETHFDVASRMFFVSLSWNVDWGRKHQADAKRINNEGTSEKVSAAGK